MQTSLSLSVPIFEVGGRVIPPTSAGDSRVRPSGAASREGVFVLWPWLWSRVSRWEPDLTQLTPRPRDLDSEAHCEAGLSIAEISCQQRVLSQ